MVLLILAAVLVSPQIYQTAKAYDFTREETAQYAYSLIPFVSDTSTASRNDLYQLLTDLTNNERKTARVHSVALGRNPAAQLHAEAALKGCYSGHWDRWGLKPNYRYTLAGGTGTGAENIFGSSYCVKSSDGFRSNSGLIAKQIQQGVQQWMNSPGHRKTLLDPAHTVLNVGIAFDSYNLVMVQQFSSDYVTYVSKPAISQDSILSFQGTVRKASLDIKQAVNFTIGWHPPSHELNASQIANTYSLCTDQQVAFLQKPLGPFQSYLSSEQTETVLLQCINAYGNKPDAAAPQSHDEASEVWAAARTASSSSTRTRTDTSTAITAGTWNVKARSFNVSANLSDITSKHGPGIYTLYLWGRPDHVNTPTVLSQQAIFWNTKPTPGHPY